MTDGPSLADRDLICKALSELMDAPVDTRELTMILRAATGWNERTCGRLGTEKLPLDQRRCDNLCASLERHIADMEAFRLWLTNL